MQVCEGTPGCLCSVNDMDLSMYTNGADVGVHQQITMCEYRNPSQADGV